MSGGTHRLASVPISHDPEGVAAIEADAIATLTDLEEALMSIEENSAT